jgi:hypothetical protein
LTGVSAKMACTSASLFLLPVMKLSSLGAIFAFDVEWFEMVLCGVRRGYVLW